MSLVMVDGALFSGDYHGIIKKWDVSNAGKHYFYYMAEIHSRITLLSRVIKRDSYYPTLKEG